MKPVSCLLLLFCLFHSACNNGGAGQLSSPGQGLIPYAQRYPRAEKKDTLLPGHIYLKYMVRRDTADGMLYICYGRPGFDSVYVQKDGAPFSCGSWEYAYHTPQTIGLMYECMGGRELLVLPLDTIGKVHAYTPLMLAVADSLLLVEDAHAAAGGPPLLIAADPDFKRQQSFRLLYDIPCADMLACFDTIYFDKKLVMKYEAAREGEEPVTRVQTEAIGWKR